MCTLLLSPYYAIHKQCAVTAVASQERCRAEETAAATRIQAVHRGRSERKRRRHKNEAATPLHQRAEATASAANAQHVGDDDKAGAEVAQFIAEEAKAQVEGAATGAYAEHGLKFVCITSPTAVLGPVPIDFACLCAQAKRLWPSPCQTSHLRCLDGEVGDDAAQTPATSQGILSGSLCAGARIRVQSQKLQLLGHYQPQLGR